MLHEIDPGPDCPELVRMIVEIPKNSRNKYEFDTALGVFRLDRVLYSPMHYPGDYGFVPGTQAADGDPIDVLVMADSPTFTGCLIEVRPIGLLDMRDEHGVDEKILAVPKSDPRFEQIYTIDQLAPHVRREIEYFFDIYKELEADKHTQLGGWKGPKEARDTITLARERFLAAREAPDRSQ
jgi:inorganic pyrophosphatase